MLLSSRDLVAPPRLLAGTCRYLGDFSVSRSAPSQAECWSLFAMSFANFVHLCCIFLQRFQLTDAICIDTDRFQSTGEKAGTDTGSLCSPGFLTEILSVGWACNQALYTYMVSTLCTMEAPRLSHYLEVLFLNRYRDSVSNFTEN